MIDKVEIQSSDGPQKLTLSRFVRPSAESEGWYSFDAQLEANGLSAIVRVDDLAPSGLAELFEEMARDWQGWQGSKQWEAMEEALSLTCTSDRTGHAFILVQMQSPHGPDEWNVRCRLRLDAAQHESISKKLKQLITEHAV